jgi:hypothetical protein
MHLKEESLINECNECEASFLEKTKEIADEKNLPGSSGNNQKKFYRSPVLTVHGTLADLIRIKINSRKN